MTKKLILLCILSVFCISPRAATASRLGIERSAAILVAPNIHTDQERIAELERRVTEAKGSADNSWMLISSALVLLMTGPGLALFYGGLVRKKNVLATLMQSFAMMAMVTIMWGLFEYSLVFGAGNSFIGGFEHLFLRGVGGDPNPDYAATIPHQTFMIYQLMFAIITPALITGGFAERMKFKAYVAIHGALVRRGIQPDGAHGLGKGRIAKRGHRRPNSHAGFRGRHRSPCHFRCLGLLVCALYLGKRLGYPRESVPPHSVVLSFVGACLLWVGWFGFNAGSALSSGALATSAFVATHFAAASAAVGWSVAEWRRSGKPSVLGAISGFVAESGRDNSRIGICPSYVRTGHWLHRGRLLLSNGCDDQTSLRV